MGLSKILGRFVGGSAVSAVEGVANIVNQFVETPDEKRAAEQMIAKMVENRDIVQTEINKIEAGHRSLFVAGWRPFIGWVCGTGLAYTFLINPVIQWFTGLPGPALPTDIMLELVLGLLGLGTLRTVEKLGGVTR